MRYDSSLTSSTILCVLRLFLEFPSYTSMFRSHLCVYFFKYVISLLKQIGYMDIWEAATLSIKKESYSIKPKNDPVITEKFSSSTSVRVLPIVFVFIISLILDALYVNINTHCN